MTTAEPQSEADQRAPAPRFGLSAKLLLLTILFVMIAEVLIYVPSIANYRLTWLADRVAVARTVAHRMGVIAPSSSAIERHAASSGGELVVRTPLDTPRRSGTTARSPVWAERILGAVERAPRRRLVVA